MKVKGALLQQGRLQSVAAIAVAAVTALAIVLSSFRHAGFAGRLAVGAAVLFTMAVILGSARAVGLTTLPMLGAAVAASATAAEPIWIRSIVIGSLWYIAAELAWDAIERRNGAIRSRALDYRRGFEVSTVVTIVLVITWSGFLASNVAPTRTLMSVGTAVVAMFVALSLATRHVGEAGPDS